MPWLAGYPREKVNWGPTVDREKCIGCGMCINCSKTARKTTKRRNQSWSVCSY
ncbi:4Fe-4S binding protein [Thermovirga lienii]|uniref:4Fe-4S binding protein n=1 Tax=Thermovirga lienii TaxID=336261 RepID=UPI002FE2C360